jgi:hypothetical protein
MRSTIDEGIAEAARRVASAFHLPRERVEAVVKRLRAESLARTFGDDPAAVIGDELARELRAEAASGLEKVVGHLGDASPVIDFPQELRPARARPPRS